MAIIGLCAPVATSIYLVLHRIIRIEEVVMTLAHMARLDHNIKFLYWIFVSPKDAFDISVHGRSHSKYFLN
jgi:hypothetical protein